MVCCDIGWISKVDQMLVWYLHQQLMVLGLAAVSKVAVCSSLKSRSMRSKFVVAGTARCSLFYLRYMLGLTEAAPM
jgi:hypothetical protein